MQSSDKLAASESDSSEVSALELDGVSLSFGALKILTDINVKVGVGEKRALLGVNGAGKTSFLNLVNGDLKADKGRIRFFGEDVTRLPSYARARRGMRRTYQISLLFGGLSVLDNLYLAIRGVSRNRFSLLRPKLGDDDVNTAKNTLNTIQLEDVADKLVSEISHGQQRQLEIGMALAGNPRFILFDEPAAGLSTEERRLLVDVLKNLPGDISYLLVEHDLDVALRVVDQVTMIHDGVIFKEGSPSEIEKDADVQELYLGVSHD